MSASLIFKTLLLCLPIVTSAIIHDRRDESHLAANFEHNRILPTTFSAVERNFQREGNVRNVISKGNPSLPSLNAIGNELSSYDFEYQIHGGGNFYGHAEKRSGKDTSGEYFVILPDFRRQVVKYYVDATGYHANVSYEPITDHDINMLNLVAQPSQSVLVAEAPPLRRRNFKKVIRKRVPKTRRSSNPKPEIY